MPFLSSRSHGRIVLCAVAIMVLFSSCGFGLSKRGSEPIVRSTLKVSYGEGLDLGAPKDAAGKTALGTLKIRVYDETNRPLSGVYVRYKGISRGKRATNGKGIMSVSLPAGRYIIDLPPCGTTKMPQSPGEVDVVIVANQTAVGNITQIPWKRRYYPTGSVKVHDDPPYARSKTVTLGVRIEDGCDFLEAPGASIRAYAWKASKNFQLVKTPTSAGGDGFATVAFRCVRSGDGSIVIYDPVKDVSVDLIESASNPAGRWCK